MQQQYLTYTQGSLMAKALSYGNRHKKSHSNKRMTLTKK